MRFERKQNQSLALHPACILGYQRCALLDFSLRLALRKMTRERKSVARFTPCVCVWLSVVRFLELHSLAINPFSRPAKNKAQPLHIPLSIGAKACEERSCICSENPETKISRPLYTCLVGLRIRGALFRLQRKSLLLSF